jgi:hypothetical protein
VTVESFSDQKIARLASKISDRSVDPRDGEVVIRQFCELGLRNVPTEYIDYLQEGFRQYLAGAKLALALGLEHPPGRPRAPQELKAAMAYQVLLARVGGMNYEEACNDVAGSFFREVTTVKSAWGERRLYALDMVIAVRSITRQPWTEEEFARLSKIFKSAASRLKTLQLNMAFVSTDE